MLLKNYITYCKFNQEVVRNEYIIFKRIVKDLDIKLLTNFLFLSFPSIVYDNYDDNDDLLPVSFEIDRRIFENFIEQIGTSA